MKYMGIDFHKQYFVSTLMDGEGVVERKDRVSTDRAAIRDYFQKVKGDEELRVVMEACRGWDFFYDEIEGLVDDVKMAHPLKTRAIAEARIKTDSLDSETLAHLLRGNLIAEAHISDAETRQKKNLIRYRISLVKMRTMLKNMIHYVLDRNHIEDPGFRELTDKFGKRGRAYMEGFTLKGDDTRIVKSYLSILDAVQKKIESAERAIQKVFEADEICRLLQTIHGVGELSAVLIRYEIGDINRFSSAKKLCSYAGLVPSVYSSGGKTYHGRITKQGNRWLRSILVELAQRATMRDMTLRQHYNKVKSRGGSRKARVAVARKLLEIIYKVWKEKRPYYEKPLAVALYST